MGKEAPDTEALYGQWVHSNEEDTADEMVFRPPEYAFPPSRGRDAFQLNADHSYVGAGIGPTDANRVSKGRWTLENDDEVRVRIEVGDRSNVLEVTHIEKDMLTIRKKR